MNCSEPGTSRGPTLPGLTSPTKSKRKSHHPLPGQHSGSRGRRVPEKEASAPPTAELSRAGRPVSPGAVHCSGTPVPIRPWWHSRALPSSTVVGHDPPTDLRPRKRPGSAHMTTWRPSRWPRFLGPQSQLWGQSPMAASPLGGRQSLSMC